jgi:hypothetical protein
MSLLLSLIESYYIKRGSGCPVWLKYIRFLFSAFPIAGPISSSVAIYWGLLPRGGLNLVPGKDLNTPKGGTDVTDERTGVISCEQTLKNVG